MPAGIGAGRGGTAPTAATVIRVPRRVAIPRDEQTNKAAHKSPRDPAIPVLRVNLGRTVSAGVGHLMEFGGRLRED